MSANKENAAIVGVGVAACAVCCAGPILGVLAAIGLGTAAGLALFGTFAILVGAAAVAFVLVRRRRHANTHVPAEALAEVPVELTDWRMHEFTLTDPSGNNVQIGRNANSTSEG